MGVDSSGMGHGRSDGALLSASDAKALVELLATIGNPAGFAPLAECKRRLFEGASRLVEAYAWVWMLAQTEDAAPRSFVAVAQLAGGWQTEREQSEACAILQSRQLQDVVPASSAIGDQESGRTYARSEIIDDPGWHASAAGQLCHALGVDHFMVCAFPGAEDATSMVWFYRRVGEA